MDSKSRIGLVYIGGFLMAVHYASIAYLNSSLLSQFVNNEYLSVLFVLGSILSITFLLFAPRIIGKFGSVLTFLFFIILEIFAVLGMGIIGLAPLVILLFLLHAGGESMLHFSLDLNLEQEIKKESTTGGKRGLFLMAQNIAWVISPLSLTFLLPNGQFSNIYFLSGIALCPLLLIGLLFFKDIKPPKHTDLNIFKTFKSAWNSGDKARIIGVQFVLNFFYSWMVIYLPFLLHKEIGFDWPVIGIIFSIMLLPFLLFQLPVGLIADKKIGEKELLVAGFVIMFLATLLLPMLKSSSFLVWAIVLFTTRIGASIVEISSESYFFKHVKEDDTGIISLFRVARPFSFIIAPLISIPIIHFLPYSTSFYFLAFFTLSGLLFIPKIDTK